MARLKRGVTQHKRHRKILKLSRGYSGRSSKCFSKAKILYERSMASSYIGRKHKKRLFRTKFIKAIGAYCQSNGVSYSKFIGMFNNSKYKNYLDRKSMALMIQYNSEKFTPIYRDIVSSY